MAGAHNLKGRTMAAPLVAIGAGVLIVHAVSIDGIGRVTASSSLRKMAEPMFASLLVPAPPVPPTKDVPTPGPSTVVQTAPMARDRLTAPAAIAPAVEAANARTAASAAASPPAAVAEPVAALPPAQTTTAQPASDTQPAPTPTPTSAPVTAPPAPDPWPADTRLSYRLEGQFRGGPLYGSARVQWQRQGPRYQVQVDIDVPPLWQLTLASQGDVTPQALVPRAYEQRTNRRRRAIRLDDAQVTLTDGRTLPRPADVQDLASQFVELGHRFATGRQALAVGSVVPVWLARLGGVDLWTYDVVAQDLLTIPRLGEVKAWRLKPRPLAQRGDNLSAEIWFSPSLQYLPVRIRLTQGDEAEFDLKVETIEQR